VVGPRQGQDRGVPAVDGHPGLDRLEAELGGRRRTDAGGRPYGRRLLREVDHWRQFPLHPSGERGCRSPQSVAFSWHSRILGSSMAWYRTELRLPPRRRGFHLVTAEVEGALRGMPRFTVGLLHVFIRHTSASLSINENADPDVPRDLEAALDAIAPEDFPHTHTAEGPDDMPAHVKASLLGSSVSLPIRDGRPCLGTWQGIYLCEHRITGGPRRIVITIHGE